MSDDAFDPRPLQPLDDYAPPALPTEETLRRLVSRMRESVSRSEEEPFIEPDRLRTAGDEMLDTLVPPPACGPLMRELDRALEDWAADPRLWRRLVVLPPCERNDLIKGWAGRYGHAIVHPPLRSDLVAADGPVNSPLDGLDPAGKGVLVFPRLEDWFLRHRNGLAQVSHLLDWLARIERPYLVGCDAWAWAFLCKAVDTHMVLPKPLTPQAFDAMMLRDWFRELAAEDGTLDRVFRLTSTGQDVFALDADGNLESDYLVTLAARSRGIPWVAWHLWRRSLRSGLDEEGEDVGDKEGRIKGEDTLWIAQVEDASLPDTIDRTPLLILHALLVHGPLDHEELEAVLPVVGRLAALPAMVEAGFLRLEDGRYSCLASGYPVIRTALSSAGMPMGVL